VSVDVDVNGRTDSQSLPITLRGPVHPHLHANLLSLPIHDTQEKLRGCNESFLPFFFSSFRHLQGRFPFLLFTKYVKHLARCTGFIFPYL
jgi:hypothetical protein